MLRGAHPYTKKTFKGDSTTRIEDIQSCTIDPAMHLNRSSQIFDGIPLYIEHGIYINQQMTDAANQLAPIIKGLATEVFEVPLQTVHLFRDTQSGKELKRRAAGSVQ